MSDSKKGIVHKRKNGYYTATGNRITNRTTIKRLDKIYIVPAYVDVQIHTDPDDPIQYTGVDEGGKKQYRYKEFWDKQQEAKKYQQLIKFGEAMPAIRKTIDTDLDKKRWTENKVVALQLRIMMLCNFRVGNIKTKATGLSTLRRKHLNIKNSTLVISFKGKSGVKNRCKIEDDRVVELIRQLANRKSKSEFLFTHQGKRVGAVQINRYLSRFGPFTSKDFRTWVANTSSILALHAKNKPTKELSLTERKKVAREAIKYAAEQLYHTPAICKKRYINNAIIQLYIEQPHRFRAVVSKHYRNKNGMNAAENAFKEFLKR